MAKFDSGGKISTSITTDVTLKKVELTIKGKIEHLLIRFTYLVKLKDLENLVR